MPCQLSPESGLFLIHILGSSGASCVIISFRSHLLLKYLERIMKNIKAGKNAPFNISSCRIVFCPEEEKYRVYLWRLPLPDSD